MDIKRAINEEIDRVFIMKCIRRRIFSMFKKDKMRNKDINDLIANILFFREDDAFFPLGKKGNWKNAAKNKLKYMYSTDKDISEDKINKIENIFIECMRMKMKKRKKRKKEIVINIRKLRSGKYVIRCEGFDIRPIYIAGKIYRKLRNTIKDEFRKNLNEIIFLTMIRYEVLLNSRNHQLGVKYTDFNIQYYDVELFASPINRTLDEFCGAYPDIDKYYKGSLGSFFDYKFESNQMYTMNPPYVDLLMTMGVKHLLKELDRRDLENVTIFITIPIWDHKTLKKLGIKVDTDVPDQGYEPHKLLSKSKYLVSLDVYNIKDYEYYNHLTGKIVPAAHTYHIVLRKYIVVFYLFRGI